MKQLVLLCLLLTSSFFSRAQAYDSAIHYRLTSPTFYAAMDTLISWAALNPADTMEGGTANRLTRDKYFWGSRVCQDITVGADMYEPLSSGLSSYFTHFSDYCPGTGSGAWTCLGPFNNDYGASEEKQGRVDAIWVNSADTSCILIGSNGGGLWKTNDGGHSWRNITDGASSSGSSVIGMAGVASIAVNPYDTNIIYIASRGMQESKKTGYFLGLMYTTDGGSTWHQDVAFNSLISATAIAEPTKVKYLPGTQELYAISEGHVLYKPSPSTSWADITPSGRFTVDGYWCQDLEFTIASAGKAVVLQTAKSNASHMLIFSSGSLISDVSMTISGYTQNDWDGPRQFSISGNDDAFIWFEVLSGSTPAHLLIKTPITSFSPSIKNSAFTGTPATACPSCSMQEVHDFIVSPANDDIIYVANYNGHSGQAIYQSRDEGGSFPYTYWSHADGRCLNLYSATNTSDGINDVVYVGTDGGIRKKRYGNNYFESITGAGLAITQFFGFGNTEVNEKIIAGGAQDNGGFAYIKDNTVPWSHVYDSWDGYTAKFLGNGTQEAIGEFNYPGLYKFIFSGGGVSTGSIPYTSDIPGTNINRPIYADQNATAFIGVHHIFKKTYSGSSWSSAFPSGGDPIDLLGSTPPAYNVVDFYLDEKNQDTVYVAYMGPRGSDAFGRLYISKFASTATPAWTNITPWQVATNAINCVAVDPSNSARIWIGLGNVNQDYVGANRDTMKRRVLYSSDYGANWTDVSKGLSALPVGKLVYRHGSDDELYAGTDVGVFRWNKATSSWDCFNNGLPACPVMDMEFNYCAGKLRIATFGRGIWETPLDNITIAPETLTTISTNTTWNTNKWLLSSVLVKTGTKLTITGNTVYMPKNGKITVEPGAQLIVDNAKITNGCDQCFWKGIEAQGNSLLPQTTANQGWVRIRNGSTIENAYVGVSNYNSSLGLTSTGGIVQGDGSFFINNQNAVTLKEYHNWSGSLLSPDRANFTNCTFLLDNNYKGNATGTPAFNNHVILQGVDGISFIGCQFLNRDTVAPFKVRGEGIHATNASIMVQAYCYSGYMGCPYPVKNRFCGFANGITIEYTGGGLPLTSNIDRALFDTVTIGINNIAMNDVLMTRNHFKIGHGRGIHGYDLTSGTFSGCYQNIGILSQGSQQFRMEENTFDGAPVTVSGWYNIGTAVAASGPFGNRVYRNTFDSLSFGVYALGDNRGTHTSIHPGLKILCNNFVHSTYDIAIATNSPYTTQGIGAEQGLHDVTYSGLDTSSGNTFSSGVTYNAVNSTTSPSYFYYRTASENPLESSTHLSSFPVSISPSCLPTFVSGLAHDATAHVTFSYVTFHKQKFREFNDEFQNTFSTYISLIDFGNTDSLKTVIGNSTDTSALYSILSGGSPYISKEALKEVATTMTLPAYSMMQILFQNPDNLRDPDFLTIIQDVYSYPGSVMDAFEDSATNQTNRTKTESAMSWLQGARDNHANIVLMALKTPIDTNSGVDSSWAHICTDTTSVYFLQDSNKHYVWLDSIDVWLQNIGGLWTDYERVGYHYFKGDMTEADNIFTDIGNSLPANSSEDTAMYVTYTKIWEAIKSAEADDRSIWSLDSTEIASLDTFSTALVTNNEAQLMIASITRIIPTSDYIPGGGPGWPGGPGVPMPPPTAPDPCLTYIEAVYKQTNDDNKDKIWPQTNNDKNQQFYAYPNPTSGIVTFAYNVPDGGNDITIVIKNIVGETVKELHTGNNTGSVKWNPDNLSSGVYLYNASSGKKVISNGKLILIK